MTTGDFAKNIYWLGHDGFRIDSVKTIYFDPFKISFGPYADIVCVSHEHFDHCSPEDIKKVSKPETVIFTEAMSAGKLEGDVRTLKPGDAADVDNVKIRTVPAYNVDKNFHPIENGWLGFIVEIGGMRIYHAGDTDFIPEMKDLEVDIALLPVSGTYVMTAEQAAEAALAIKPKLAIPMHYGAIVGGANDAEKFKTLLEGKIDVMILPKS